MKYYIAEGGKEMETLSIYYNDFDNTFEDEHGATEDNLDGIMSNEDILEYKQVGGTYYREVNGSMYEIVFPIRDAKRVFHYDIEENVMFNEDGIMMFNIFSVIRPSSLMLFKKGKKTMEVDTITGGWAELIWPDCLP